jgi:hypothetical protein
MPAPSGYPTSTVPDWATNPGVRVTPPVGLQATGWVPGTVLPALTGNGLWGPLADWCGYLEASSPSLGTWDVVDLNVWSGATQYGDLTTATVSGSTMMTLRSTLAAAGLAISCLGGDRTTLLLDATTDTASIFDVTGATNHWQSTAAGGFIGPRASADGTSGIRYAYPAADPATIRYTVTPSSGGWTDGVGLMVGQWLVDVNEYWRPYNVTGILIASVTSRRSLGEFIGANAEWSATGTATLTRLSAELDCAGVGQDVTVTVMRRTRATPATVVATAATVTRATAGAATVTWTGSVLLEVSAYEYFVQAEVLGLPAAASAGSGVRLVTFDLDKTAVE